MNTRPMFIGGNWKMHGDRASATALARDVAAGCAKDVEVNVETAIFPTFVHLDPVATLLAHAPAPPLLGAQDAFHEPQGAFTGEVSVPMLADLGVRAVLTGHSERRHILGESDELVARKTRAVLDGGLL
ncbi:MAG: triosephosphate isomerase, partial [Planctomycetota bacterium]